VILYVVTDTEKNYRSGTAWYAIARTLEELSGDACLIVHYRRVDLRFLRAVRPWAVCHSGGGTDFAEYDVLQTDAYRQAVQRCPAPQLGLCGGHQIIARFFGSRIGPMRKLRPDEPDPTGYRPGYFKEWGVYPVRIVKKDPIFRGLGPVIRVQENHYWEVKTLGPDLVLLASSDNCRVQTFVHRQRPTYGTQFHPESSPQAYPDGFTVLRNFFGLARRRR
jgi:GMP synthase-like glutamine amidotransferase